jgi:hypothetical protein
VDKAVVEEAGVVFLETCVVLMSRRFFNRILAISMVIPQKSGMRCEHVWWQVRPHSAAKSVQLSEERCQPT